MSSIHSGAMRRTSRLAAITLTIAALAACGGNGEETAAPPPPPPPPPPSGPVVKLMAGVQGDKAAACGLVNGITGAARLGMVADMAVSKDGKTYLLEHDCGADAYLPAVMRQVDANGDVTTEAAQADPQARPPQSFTTARNLAIGSTGAVYISQGNTPSSGVSLPEPSPTPRGTAAGLWRVTNRTVTPFVGIERLTNPMRDADGTGTDAEFVFAPVVTYGEGDLYGCVDNRGPVRRITEAGVVTTVDMPCPVLADRGDALYWLDGNALQQLSGTRRIELLPEQLPLARPRQLAMTADGTLYAVRKDSAGNASVYRRKPDGSTEPVMGIWQGQTTLQPLAAVNALGLDASGRLYVLERHALWRITF